jgi:hypothetical protein
MSSILGRASALSTIVVGATLIVVGCASESGTDGAQESNVEAASCSGAKVDDRGVCRDGGGKFAKSSCCVAAALCAAAKPDAKGVCRATNGQFVPTSCCSEICAETVLDKQGICRHSDGRFALAGCCADECSAKQAAALAVAPSCRGAGEACAFGDLQKTFRVGDPKCGPNPGKFVSLTRENGLTLAKPARVADPNEEAHIMTLASMARHVSIANLDEAFESVDQGDILLQTFEKDGTKFIAYELARGDTPTALVFVAGTTNVVMSAHDQDIDICVPAGQAAPLKPR